MDTLSYKTVSANKKTVNKEWLLVDAENEVLGRLASKVAKLLRGKHKPEYTPHMDCGDNIIIINAEKVNLTGNKKHQKQYIRYTGYPSGKRINSVAEVMAKKPTFMVEQAVKGMLPKNKLGRQLFKNMHVFVDDKHPHEAQKPKKINLNSIK